MIRHYGVDPEFGVANSTFLLDGNPLPNIIPPEAFFADKGMKFTLVKKDRKMIKCVYTGRNHSWIADGPAFEMNCDPVTTPEDLYHLMGNAYTSLGNLLRPYDPKLFVSKNQIGKFDADEYWVKRGEEFRDCVRAGCDPDTFPNLYAEMALDKNKGEMNLVKDKFRYFGGHLHIENVSNDPDIYVKELDNAAICLDFFIGCLNVAYKYRPSSVRSQELIRLERYGHPGRVRLQKYSQGKNGIEYRPLSNYWLNEFTLMKQIFIMADLAATLIESGKALDFVIDMKDYIPAMFNACITMDKNKAGELFFRAVEWTLKRGLVLFNDISSINAFL